MTALPVEVESSAEHTAKRKQIMDGARRVFMEHGFDGASVNDIVRATGVSKGTVYAYFPSKEKLFETLIFEDRRGQAERLFEILDESRPVEEMLREIGLRFGKMLIDPQQVAYFRMIIAASAKFPQAGRAFYEAGPRYGIARITAYIEEKVRQGELKTTDPEMAARQLMELIHCGTSKPLLFGVSDSIATEELNRVVNAGVATFLAAYGRRT
ncbi:MAG: TetR/AcrR family transcriptional regulator [Rhizobiales bacterium]|nr:TetR/AcrR family transcriptional regulator [Hyphomicrobiales bacterium]